MRNYRSCSKRTCEPVPLCQLSGSVWIMVKTPILACAFSPASPRLKKTTNGQDSRTRQKNPVSFRPYVSAPQGVKNADKTGQKRTPFVELSVRQNLASKSRIKCPLCGVSQGADKSGHYRTGRSERESDCGISTLPMGMRSTFQQVSVDFSCVCAINTIVHLKCSNFWGSPWS